MILVAAAAARRTGASGFETVLASLSALALGGFIVAAKVALH